MTRELAVGFRATPNGVLLVVVGWLDVVPRVLCKLALAWHVCLSISTLEAPGLSPR